MKYILMTGYEPFYCTYFHGMGSRMIADTKVEFLRRYGAKFRTEQPIFFEWIEKSGFRLECSFERDTKPFFNDTSMLKIESNYTNHNHDIFYKMSVRASELGSYKRYDDVWVKILLYIDVHNKYIPEINKVHRSRVISREDILYSGKPYYELKRRKGVSWKGISEWLRRNIEHEYNQQASTILFTNEEDALLAKLKW